MKAASSNVHFFGKDHAVASVTGSRPWPGAVAISADRRTAVMAHLTPRQLEVLALLCEGLPNKLICRRLNIATGTVKVHISCILRELGVTSRLQAVVAARNLGLAGENAAVARTPAAAAILDTSRQSTATGLVPV